MKKGDDEETEKESEKEGGVRFIFLLQLRRLERVMSLWWLATVILGASAAFAIPCHFYLTFVYFPITVTRGSNLPLIN